MAGLKTSLRRGSSLSTSLTSLGARAPSQGGGGGADLYYFSSGAFRWATQVQSVGASDTYLVVRKYLGYFDQPTYGHRFFFPTFCASSTSGTGPEVNTTSPILLERIAVVSSPTQAATNASSVATFGQFAGADSYLLDPAVNLVGIMSDDIGTKEAMIPAGHLFLEYAYKVNANLNYPRAFPLAPSQSVEGSTSSTSISQASKVGVRQALTVSATAANVYTPSFSVCKGIDGADIVLGDSKCYGEQTPAYGAILTNRGWAWGTYGMKWAAMDRPVFIAAVPGSSPVKWVGNGGSIPGTADLPNYWAKKKAALSLVPNFPADRIFTQHGGNAAEWTTAAGYRNGQAALKAFYLSEFAVSLPVFCCLIPTRLASSSDGYNTVGGQTPVATYQSGGAVRTVQAEMLADNMGSVFAGYVDGWTAYGDDSDPSKAPANSGTGQAATVATAYTSGSTTLVLDDASAFSIGDFIRLDPTGAGAAANAIYILNKSGNTLTLPTNGFGYSASIGAAVVGSYIADGTHETTQGHKRSSGRISVPLAA